MPIVLLADILDGTSNTAAFSEKVKGIGAPGNPNTNVALLDRRIPSSTPVLLPKPATADLINPQAFFTQCRATGPGTPGATYVNGLYPFGFFWFQGISANTRYNHLMPPNSHSCVYGTGSARWGDAGGAYAASSRHPGGANVCFADGSVKFIKATITPPVWWALGTRDGGEAISADQF